MLDLRPKGRGFEPHRRHRVVSLSKNIKPSLVLVQPRKTRPFITERLLMGRKESNQTNKQTKIYLSIYLSVCLSVRPSVLPPTRPPTYPSTHPSIQPRTNPRTHPHTNPPNYLPTYLPIYLSGPSYRPSIRSSFAPPPILGNRLSFKYSLRSVVAQW